MVKHMSDGELLARHNKGQRPYRDATQLRNEATYAYLDGRTAMAKEWNRRADRLGKLNCAA